MVQTKTRTELQELIDALLSVYHTATEQPGGVYTIPVATLDAVDR